MKPFKVNPCACASGVLSLGGDKSIAHRALIISALAAGTTTIRNVPANDDCLATIKALKDFGVKITRKLIKDRGGSSLVVVVRGRGLNGLKAPSQDVFAGESGTTFRLLAGVAAGQPFQSELTAGLALSHRPMARIAQPLRLMGARIIGCHPSHSSPEEEYPPLIISGGHLRAIHYTPPVASAQVKSAILLAGLYAQGATIISEPVKTRDHTERMLKAFGVPVSTKGNIVMLRGGAVSLSTPRRIVIPGDISSASFFMVLAAILPKSRIVIEGVSLNPGRLGAVKVLRRMGASITVTSGRLPPGKFEPSGNLTIRSSRLKGTRVAAGEIPSLIDELPVLMVAAAYAQGATVFEGVGELRVKETDRIKSMSGNLQAMGAGVKVCSGAAGEGIEITGGGSLCGTSVKSFGDHRTAMSMVIAALGASGQTLIDDVSCIHKSFPGFLDVINELTGRPGYRNHK